MTKRLLTKKIILPTVAAVFVVGGLTAYLLPKLKIIVPLRLKYSQDASPRMYLVPQKRNIDASVSADDGYPYESGNLRFRLQWKAIRSFESEYAQAFVFEGEKTVIVSGQKKGEGILPALLGDLPEQAEAMRQFWGEENLQSEYAVFRYCLNATPDKGGVFTDRAELLRLPSLLLLKAVYSPLGDVIYQFETRQFRGFQFGNPGTAQEIFVYLYDSSDQLFRFKLSALDQQEIDRLLASITIDPQEES